MASALLRFGSVMLVVMIGFAMALHVLLRDLEDFGDTFLSLFKTMLGDTDFFTDFSGGRYDIVATILVVVYLFIVNVMLLNLLIAILSTAHAQVQEDVGGEFQVSNARIVDYYRTVVDKELLPVPFNLLQLVLSLPIYHIANWSARVAEALDLLRQTSSNATNFRACMLECAHAVFTAAYRIDVSARATEGERIFWAALGQFVFWLVLGPVTVAGGTVLWGLSGFPFSQYAIYMKYREHLEALETFVKVMIQGLLANTPLVSRVLWLLEALPLYF